MTDQSAAISQLVADAERAQFELEALTALHTDQTVIVNVAGCRLFGRESFAEAMTAAMATPLANVTTRLVVDDLRFLRPDVAVVSCTKHIHDEGSIAPASRGVLTYVAVAEQGEWRIALAQTTPDTAFSTTDDE